MFSGPTQALKALGDSKPKENPNKISDVECECGCHTLMTVGWLRKGKTQRRYLYGHKPTTTAATPSGVRKHVKTNMGPEQIQAYFTAQSEQLKQNGAKLKAEAETLLAQAKAKMAAAREIDEQITQIRTVQQQTQEALSRVFNRKKSEA